MNLSVLRWLLSHRAVLTQVLEAAKAWNPDADLLAKWQVVDQIARLLLPVFASEDVSLMTIENTTDYAAYDIDEAFELGVQAAALGINWKQLIEVIVPIVIALLEALDRVR